MLRGLAFVVPQAVPVENPGDSVRRERSWRKVLFWSNAANNGLHAFKSTCQAPWAKDISSDEGQPVGG